MFEHFNIDLNILVTVESRDKVLLQITARNIDYCCKDSGVPNDSDLIKIRRSVKDVLTKDLTEQAGRFDYKKNEKHFLDGLMHAGLHKINTLPFSEDHNKFYHVVLDIHPMHCLSTSDGGDHVVWSSRPGSK